MSTYLFAEKFVHKTDPTFNELLAVAYQCKIRPVCCCRYRDRKPAPQELAGLAMYIVRIDGMYYLKRMPETGPNHDPSCTSYEPPAELSGLGQLIGAAIVESAVQGSTTLKLAFSLSKASARAVPIPGPGDLGSAHTDGTKLTLRALMHYLWDQAGFPKWSPLMTGKRNWGVIRKYLLRAAEHKHAKGKALADILYIPEPYEHGQRELIAQRRTARLARTLESTGRAGARQLMVMLAEVKTITPSRNGHKLLLKHVPDYFFTMNEDLHQRLQRRFELELSLWDAIPGTHLIAAATFGNNRAGVAALDEVALMVATEHWIPFESSDDKTLIDTLTRAERRFVKSMRYNLPPSTPLASAVLTDTPTPTALYIHSQGAGEDYSGALDELIRDSRMASWTWHPGAIALPALPDRQKPPKA